MVVILCASVLGLSLACISFEVYERANFRSSMTNELSALAGTLGANTAASLTFNDRKSAREMLGALRAESHSVAACLYDAGGNLFAEYRREASGQGCRKSDAREEGARFEAESVTLFRSISLGEEKTGVIAIISDLDALHAKIREYTEISAAVMVLSFLATFLVSSRLLRLITEPILQLAGTATRVTAQENYTLRAVAIGRDEVGTLIGAFNQMLERIQERDTALQEAKDDLELRVQARTQELQQEVDERRQAEEKLQLSIKELTDLKFALDQHCIVARTDAQGTITFVNEKFCSVSKYSPEELIGRTHQIVNSGHHPKEFFADLWSTIKSGRSWKGEVKNRAKDGSTYWVDTTIVPFCDAQG